MLYLGVDLDFYGKNMPSLDRIDSYKDYTIDNVQWVNQKINFMKQSLTDEDFIKTCKEVAKYNEQKHISDSPVPSTDAPGE